MQVRWRNNKKNPIPGSPAWINFTARYPFILIIPTGLLFYLTWFFWNQFARMEAGQLNSVYVGKLKIVYDIFGKWGVSGFFAFIGLCGLYLFWYYAVSD